MQLVNMEPPIEPSVSGTGRLPRRKTPGHVSPCKLWKKTRQMSNWMWALRSGLTPDHKLPEKPDFESWRVETSWHGSSKEHVDALTAQASLNCLQQSRRETETPSSLFLLLTSSQVYTAILSKGKPSTSMVFVDFCSSKDIRSNIPSRWQRMNFRRAQKLFAESQERRSAR